jgi:hypothetical protein
MALTNAQLGQLAQSIYTAWSGVSSDPGDLARAMSIVRQYLEASASKTNWNAVAPGYGLPLL